MPCPRNGRKEEKKVASLVEKGREKTKQRNPSKYNVKTPPKIPVPSRHCAPLNPTISLKIYSRRGKNDKTHKQGRR